MAAVPQPKLVGLVLLISLISVLCGFLLGRNQAPHSIIAPSTSVSPLLAAGQLTPMQRNRLNRLENIIQTKEESLALHSAVLASPQQTSFSQRGGPAACPSQPHHRPAGAGGRERVVARLE